MRYRIYIKLQMFLIWGLHYESSPTQTISGTGNNVAGMTLGFGNEKMLIRGSYGQVDLDLNVITPSDNLTTAGGSTFINRTNIIVPLRGIYRIGTVGTRINLANFLILSEYVSVNSDSAVRRYADGFYATLGYYLFDRTLLPHFTHATNFNSEARLFDRRQVSETVGVNYFIGSQIVLKGDWQYIQAFSGANGNFAIPPGKAQHLFDLSLNVVF